jgi:hypothetical protein
MHRLPGLKSSYLSFLKWLGWQARTTGSSHWLRLGLTNFWPRLTSNPNSDLYLLSSKDYSLEPAPIPNTFRSIPWLWVSECTLFFGTELPLHLLLPSLGIIFSLIMWVSVWIYWEDFSGAPRTSCTLSSWHLPVCDVRMCSCLYPCPLVHEGLWGLSLLYLQNPI